MRANSNMFVELGVLCWAAVVRAGAVVDLVPDQTGPYLGGESLNVDVWLYNEESFDARLQLIQFAFLDTDPALSLDSTFKFDYTSLVDPSGYAFGSPELPVPSTANMLMYYCPECFLLLPAGGAFHAGSLGVQLPSDVGIFRLDALNADEANQELGAVLSLTYVPDGLLIWQAFTGEITGGTYDFVVVPEPATLLLLGFVGLLVPCARRLEMRSYRFWAAIHSRIRLSRMSIGIAPPESIAS